MTTRTTRRAAALFLTLLGPSLAWAADEPRRTVTDLAGRSVSVPQRVGRVATLGSVPVINSMLFAAGAGDRIVNGLPDFAAGPRWRYQTVFAPDMSGKPRLQGADRAPLVEKLLEAAPDVVFTMDRPVADQLAAHKLPVVYLAWRQPEDVKLAMNLVADIVGAPAAATRYARFFDDTIQRVAAAVDKAGAARPKVLYLAAGSMQQPHLVVEWWIRAAGGISVTDDGRTTEARAVSIEQVLAWDPDVLVLNAPSDLNVIGKDSRFGALKAVKAGRVVLTPMGAHTWANRTVENPLTVLWAAKTFHPAVFAALDLETEVRNFYEQFFGTRLSVEQVREILSGRV
ncbi:MAG: ABC transporter substrate-binding protein [Rubrivivax sp.]